MTVSGHEPVPSGAVTAIASRSLGGCGDAAASVKVSGTGMTMSTAANIQHSLRRLSTGSLIRLEPRPQQHHHLQQQQQQQQQQLSW